MFIPTSEPQVVSRNSALRADVSSQFTTQTRPLRQRFERRLFSKANNSMSADGGTHTDQNEEVFLRFGRVGQSTGTKKQVTATAASSERCRNMFSYGEDEPRRVYIACNHAELRWKTTAQTSRVLRFSIRHGANLSANRTRAADPRDGGDLRIIPVLQIYAGGARANWVLETRQNTKQTARFHHQDEGLNPDVRVRRRFIIFSDRQLRRPRLFTTRAGQTARAVFRYRRRAAFDTFD